MQLQTHLDLLNSIERKSAKTKWPSYFSIKYFVTFLAIYKNHERVSQQLKDSRKVSADLASTNADTIKQTPKL